MNWHGIVNVLLAIASVFLSFVSYYFSIRAKIEKEVNGIIDDAEANLKIGKEKKAYVVCELYKLIPAVYRPMFSQAFMEKIVQFAFDKIESYAKKQKK